MFNLKEEELKQNQKIKITYKTNEENENEEENENIKNKQNENEKTEEITSLDKSLQLYKNNINIKKPKYLGKLRALLYFRNSPIFVLTESSN